MFGVNPQRWKRHHLLYFCRLALNSTLLVLLVLISWCTVLPRLHSVKRFVASFCQFPACVDNKVKLIIVILPLFEDRTRIACQFVVLHCCNQLNWSVLINEKGKHSQLLYTTGVSFNTISSKNTPPWDFFYRIRLQFFTWQTLRPLNCLSYFCFLFSRK